MKSFAILMTLFFITYIPLFYVATSDLKKFLGQNFVICVVLSSLAGIYLPNIPIYFIAIVVLFLSTVRGRIDAACRFILLAAFIPEILWQIGAQGHYFGTFDSAGALALAAYGLARFGEQDARASTGRGWRPEDFLVLTLFLIFTVGGVGFVKLDDSLRAWIQEFLLIVMPYALFRTTLKTTADYRAAIACFGVASLFLAIFAMYEARMSADIFDVITKHLTGYYIRNMDMRGGLMRASATMGGPLALACFMTVGILAIACSRDFFKNAIGYYGCLVVATLGLLATQSRGSLVAVLVSAVVLSLALRKWGIAAAATVVAGAAWPVLQMLANVSPAVASFMNGGAAIHQGKYYDYRNLLLQRGLEVAADHPLTGMHMTQVLDALSDITQGEGIVDLVNVYLVILLISGLVGLLPFLGLTLTSGWRGTFGFKRIQDRALLRARGFSLAAFTVVLLQLSFVSFIDRLPMVFVLTLCGIRLLAQQRLALPDGLAAELPVPEAPPLAAEHWVHADGDADEHEPDWVPRLPMISA